MTYVRVQIVRWVDDTQPGWVECVLTDAHQTSHRFVEKAPVVSRDELSRESRFPCTGELACVVVGAQQLPTGRSVLLIDTQHPYGLETMRGQSRFEVLSDHVCLGEEVRITVRSGTWLYGGIMSCAVRIVATSLSGAETDGPQTPMFFVEWYSPDDSHRTSSSVGPFGSVHEAEDYASQVVNSTIEWLPARDGPPN